MIDDTRSSTPGRGLAARPTKRTGPRGPRKRASQPWKRPRRASPRIRPHEAVSSIIWTRREWGRIIRRVSGGTIRADVAVLGGGLAGLSAAIGFARRGRRVCVLERDRAAGDDAAPEVVFDGWEREGVAHFRQPHNFLGLGRQTLIDEAPDVLDRVVAAGAFENRQYELVPGDPEPGDDELVSICIRRPVFESVLRAAATAEPNVTVESGARIAGLVGAQERGNGTVRVTGARTTDGRAVEADLVVDALGRTSQLGSWLGELGARPLTERRAECGLLYYSRHFRLRPGVELPSLPSLLRGPRGEIGYLVFVVFLGDNRTFALVLMIPPWERELRVLKREAAYMTTASRDPAARPVDRPRLRRADHARAADGKPAQRASVARRRRRPRRGRRPARGRRPLSHEPDVRPPSGALSQARLRARERGGAGGRPACAVAPVRGDGGR